MTPPPDPLEKWGDRMTNLEPLRDRLLSLRRQTLSLLASRPEDESLDAELLAVEETIKADGL